MEATALILIEPMEDAPVTVRRVDALAGDGAFDVEVCTPAATPRRLRVLCAEGRPPAVALVGPHSPRTRSTLAQIPLEHSPKPLPNRLDHHRLLLSDRYLASILEQTEDAMRSIDREGRLLTWNRAAERGGAVRVVFVTVLEGEALQQEAEEMGCVAYLRKPFEAVILIAAIRRACAPAVAGEALPTKVMRDTRPAENEGDHLP